MDLKPLLPGNSKAKAFSVVDIETSKWTRFLVIGHYDGFQTRFFYGKKAWLRFFEYIAEHPDRLIFAHWGGIFDFQFVMEAAISVSAKYKLPIRVGTIIPRGSKILCFDLEIGDVKIKFTDSSALLPFGLYDLTRNFNVKHKKLDVDAGKFTRVTPKLLHYLEHDLKGTFEVIEAFYEWPIVKASGRATTIASQALRFLRSTIKKPIYGGTEKIDAFCREAYFGGRVEIFNPVHKGPEILHYYDVNSIYPWVMKKFDYPGNYIGRTDELDLSQMGIWDVTVEVPNQFIPPLPAKIDGKLLFPIGKFRGKWCTPELKYAMRHCGVKILKFHEGHIFENYGKLFRNFVDTLWKIRENSEKDSIDNILSKLLMNSCYGKLAQQLVKEQIEFDDFDRPGRPMPDYELKISGKTVCFLKREKSLRAFTHVGISAFVTAYARVELHRIFRRANWKVYYCDTDSLFTTEILPVSGGLGCLKREAEIRSAVFLLPKTYTFRTKTLFKVKDGKKERRTRTKTVMKGFPRKLVKAGYEDFAAALEGDLKRLRVKVPPKFATFKTALRMGSLVTLTKGSSKEIRSFYNKRIVVRNGSEWTTRPIEVTEVKDGNANG